MLEGGEGEDEGDGIVEDDGVGDGEIEGEKKNMWVNLKSQIKMLKK